VRYPGSGIAARLMLAFVGGVVAAGARARAADVSVTCNQVVGTQGLLYGTNELPDHIRYCDVLPDRLSELGTDWVRYWVPGSYVHPAPGSWDWERLDNAVARITAGGAKVMICFEGVPDWMAATPTGKDLTNHPRDMGEWAAHCVAIVAHCAGLGYPVEDWMWEIWNEPDGTGWTIEEYMELYDAAAGAMRAAFAGLSIGGPSTIGPWGEWITPL
jgi:hypothetical protein